MQFPTIIRTSKPICYALLLTGLLSTSLSAQNQPDTQPKYIRAPQMSDKPFTIPSLGLTLRIPADAILDMAPPTAGATGARIWPQDESEGWHITVFSSITSDRSQNANTALDALISSFEALYPVNLERARPNPNAKMGQNPATLVRLIRRDDNLLVGSARHHAARAYLDVPNVKSGVARGYTVFQTGRGQFVIFQLQAPQDSFAAARLTYETIITLAHFRDPVEINAERATPLLAGASFLEMLTKKDYDQAAEDRTVFYRLYAPSTSEEIAWQRVQIKLGQLGDLNPNRPKTSWSQPEREFGYLVTVDARALVKDKTLDTKGLFFLSRDRKTERWSLKTEVIDGKRVLDSQTQTLVRDDKHLTIRTESPGSSPSTVDYRVPDKGYISRVEVYLLPSLVAKMNVPVSFAFYNFDPQLNKLTLRRETFSSRNSGKGWLQTTKLTEDATTHETIRDANGRLLRQTLASGVVMEPTNRNQLLALWRDSTLPSSR